MIGIDGVSEVANYVRYPSDWERIVAERATLRLTR